MPKKQGSSQPLQILAMALICAVDILWVAGWIYHWKMAGMLIPTRMASTNLPMILGQHLWESVVLIVLFVVFLVLLKGRFAKEMYLRVTGKKQWAAVGMLSAVLLGMFTYCLVVKSDKITVAYALFYYLVIIAFSEELICRGVCVWLVKDEKAALRYLLPNALFALMHVFSYTGWGDLTGAYILRFLTGDLLGLLVGGCFLQFLKEKSGTIWIPVLLHAIMDYSAVFSYT